jgi:hypothetical protein
MADQEPEQVRQIMVAAVAVGLMVAEQTEQAQPAVLVAMDQQLVHS